MSGFFGFPQDRRQSSRAEPMNMGNFDDSPSTRGAPNNNSFNDQTINSPDRFFLGRSARDYEPSNTFPAPVHRRYETAGIPLQHQLSRAPPTSLPFSRSHHDYTFQPPNLEWAFQRVDSQAEQTNNDEWASIFAGHQSYGAPNALHSAPQDAHTLYEPATSQIPATPLPSRTNSPMPTDAAPNPRGRDAPFPTLPSIARPEIFESRASATPRTKSKAPQKDPDTVVAPGKKRRGKSRKQVDEVYEPPSPPLRSSGLYFSSTQHARQEVKGLRWGPRLDDTLPTSQEEREAIVQELFDAMQDMSSIQDKKSSLMLKKRWLSVVKSTDPDQGSQDAEVGEEAEMDGNSEDAQGDESQAAQRVASNEVYKPWVKERVCWELLEIAERIYVEGAGFVRIFDPVALQECEKWRYLSFRKRINMVIQVCKEFKSRVDKMLRGGVLEEYVLCPGMLLKNSKSNRHHNDVRKDDIAAGRKRAGRPSKRVEKVEKAEKTIVPASDGKRKRDDDDNDDDNDDDEPVLTKKSRSSVA